MMDHFQTTIDVLMKQSSFYYVECGDLLNVCSYTLWCVLIHIFFSCTFTCCHCVLLLDMSAINFNVICFHEVNAHVKISFAYLGYD